ncbi:hypothetical protein C8J57DRAFT_1538043 [Mycena rebaudengoi]|nr:hypothetical protein C8J57DRAFT_1538043 [Mycena rebaudengoi]
MDGMLAPDLLAASSFTLLGLQNVQRFVKACFDLVLNGTVSEPWHEPDDLSLFPTVVLARIIAHLGIYDTFSFGKALKRCKALVAASLQFAATAMLQEFQLDFADMQLLNTANNTLISGSAVIALAEPTPTFFPNNIDFYCKAGTADETVDYLHRVSTFTVHLTQRAEYDTIDSIQQVVWLENPRGMRINVMESWTNSALDPVLAFHSTLRAVWSGKSLWFAHPSLVDCRLALATPLTLLIALTVKDQYRVWNIIHKYLDRGFQWVFEYEKPHTCGEHHSCPLTLRCTADAGCLVIPFPPSPLNAR